MIGKEEYLKSIDALMELEGKSLTTEQRKIVEGIFTGQTYEKIQENEDVNMNLTNIKKNMSQKIFPLLSQAIKKKYGISQKIKKNNLRSIIDSCYQKEYEQQLKTNPLMNRFQCNDIKLEIFNNLQGQFEEWDPDKKYNYAKLIKIYWLKVYEDNEEASKKIDYKTIEEIFKIIIDMDEEKASIINIFSSLAKNSCLEESIKHWFEVTTEDLRKAFTISKENFQDWTANPIEVEKIDISETPNTSIYQQNYLSLKIRKSDNKSSNHKSIITSHWDIKWKLVNQQFNNSDEGKTWKNLCLPKAEDLNYMFKQLLKDGIPIAIWSRYHQKYEQHYQEINNIVIDCQGNDTVDERYIKIA